MRPRGGCGRFCASSVDDDTLAEHNSTRSWLLMLFKQRLRFAHTHAGPQTQRARLRTRGVKLLCGPLALFFFDSVTRLRSESLSAQATS